jgi:signal peptidase I
MRLSEKTFGVLCLSAAAGLLLYWISYMIFLTALLDLRSELYLTNPNVLTISSAIVGAACSALIYLGYSELTAPREIKPSIEVKSKTTLILRRDPYGRAISIYYGEPETAPSVQPQETTPSSESTPLPPEIRGLRAQETIRRPNAKGLLGILALLSLILGSYSSIVVLGFSPQEAISGSSPFVIVSSESMSPCLKPGDLVVLKKIPEESIQVGDIVAFRIPFPYDSIYPSPMVHKVVEKWTEGNVTYFRTKGDANLNPDAWNLPSGNVLGKSIATIPYVGLPILFVKTNLGLLLLSIILVGYLLYVYHRSR